MEFLEGTICDFGNCDIWHRLGILSFCNITNCWAKNQWQSSCAGARLRAG